MIKLLTIPAQWVWQVAAKHMQWVRVLTYHSINHGDSPLTISPAEFELQMQWIKTHFTPIRLSQLMMFLDSGISLPPNPVLITFDDGYQDNLTHAFPVLSRYEIPAIIFVATGFVGSRMPLYADMLPMLSWSEMHEMRVSGLVEFGAHTRTHVRLSEVPSQIAWKTIVDSKSDLEDNLGVAIDAFCYPQNRCNSTVIALVQRAGFRVAFCKTGFIHRYSLPYELQRIQVDRTTSLAELAQKLDTDLKSLSGLFINKVSMWRDRLRLTANLAHRSIHK